MPSDSVPRARIAADQTAAILSSVRHRPKADHIRVLAERADYVVRALRDAVIDMDHK